MAPSYDVFSFKGYAPSFLTALGAVAINAIPLVHDVAFVFSKAGLTPSSLASSPVPPDNPPVALTYVDPHRPTPTIQTSTPTPTLSSGSDVRARRLAVFMFLTLLSTQILLTTMVASNGKKVAKDTTKGGQRSSTRQGYHPMRHHHRCPQRSPAGNESNSGDEERDASPGGDGDDPSNGSDAKENDHQAYTAEGFPEDPSDPDPNPPNAEDARSPRNPSDFWKWILLLLVIAIAYFRPEWTEYLNQNTLQVVLEVMESVEYWTKQSGKRFRKMCRRGYRNVERNLKHIERQRRFKAWTTATAPSPIRTAGNAISTDIPSPTIAFNSTVTGTALSTPTSTIKALATRTCQALGFVSISPTSSTAAKPAISTIPAKTLTSPTPFQHGKCVSRYAFHGTYGILVLIASVVLAVCCLPVDFFGSRKEVILDVIVSDGNVSKQVENVIVQDVHEEVRGQAAAIEAGTEEDVDKKEAVVLEDRVTVEVPSDKQPITGADTIIEESPVDESWLEETDEDTLVVSDDNNSLSGSSQKKHDLDVKGLIRRYFGQQDTVIVRPVLVSPVAQPRSPSSWKAKIQWLKEGRKDVGGEQLRKVVGMARKNLDDAAMKAALVLRQVDDVFRAQEEAPSSGPSRPWSLRRPRPPTPQHIMRKSFSPLKYVNYDSEEEASEEMSWGKFVKSMETKANEDKKPVILKDDVEAKEDRMSRPEPPSTPRRSTTTKVRCFSPTANSSPNRRAGKDFPDKFFKFDFSKVCNFSKKSKAKTPADGKEVDPTELQAAWSKRVGDGLKKVVKAPFKAGQRRWKGKGKARMPEDDMWNIEGNDAMILEEEDVYFAVKDLATQDDPIGDVEAVAKTSSGPSITSRTEQASDRGLLEELGIDPTPSQSPQAPPELHPCTFVTPSPTAEHTVPPAPTDVDEDGTQSMELTTFIVTCPIFVPIQPYPIPIAEDISAGSTPNRSLKDAQASSSTIPPDSDQKSSHLEQVRAVFAKAIEQEETASISTPRRPVVEHAITNPVIRKSVGVQTSATSPSTSFTMAVEDTLAVSCLGSLTLASDSFMLDSIHSAPRRRRFRTLRNELRRNALENATVKGLEMYPRIPFVLELGSAGEDIEEVEDPNMGFSQEQNNVAVGQDEDASRKDDELPEVDTTGDTQDLGTFGPPEPMSTLSLSSEVDVLFEDWSLLGLLDETRSRMSSEQSVELVQGSEHDSDHSVEAEGRSMLVEVQEAHQSPAGSAVQGMCTDQHLLDIVEDDMLSSLSCLPPLPPSPPLSPSSSLVSSTSSPRLVPLPKSADQSSVDDIFDHSRLLAFLNRTKSRLDGSSSSIAPALEPGGLSSERNGDGVVEGGEGGPSGGEDRGEVDGGSATDCERDTSGESVGWVVSSGSARRDEVDESVAGGGSSEQVDGGASGVVVGGGRNEDDPTANLFADLESYSSEFSIASLIRDLDSFNATRNPSLADLSNASCIGGEGEEDEREKEGEVVVDGKECSIVVGGEGEETGVAGAKGMKEEELGMDVVDGVLPGNTSDPLLAKEISRDDEHAVGPVIGNEEVQMAEDASSPILRLGDHYDHDEGKPAQEVDESNSEVDLLFDGWSLLNLLNETKSRISSSLSSSTSSSSSADNSSSSMGLLQDIRAARKLKKKRVRSPVGTPTTPASPHRSSLRRSPAFYPFPASRQASVNSSRNTSINVSTSSAGPSTEDRQKQGGSSGKSSTTPNTSLVGARECSRKSPASYPLPASRRSSPDTSIDRSRNSKVNSNPLSVSSREPKAEESEERSPVKPSSTPHVSLVGAREHLKSPPASTPLACASTEHAPKTPAATSDSTVPLPPCPEEEDQQAKLRGHLAIPGFIPTSPELGQAKSNLREAPERENVPVEKFTLHEMKLRRVQFSPKKTEGRKENGVGNVFGVALRKVNREGGDVGKGDQVGKACAGPENATKGRVVLGEVNLRRANIASNQGACKDTSRSGESVPVSNPGSSSVAAIWKERERRAQRQVPAPLAGSGGGNAAVVSGGVGQARDFWSRKR